MKKRAYLAGLALCLALTGTACGPESPASGTSSNGETAGSKETETAAPAETPGFGTRLVSVDNVEKYISLAEYKGLVLDKNVYEITDDQVDEQVRYSLEPGREELNGEASAIQNGDLVTIGYVGTVGGVVLETEDSFDLTVGEGGMTEGFEEGLLGMKKGETKTLNLVFPEDFYAEELAGAVVVYKVTIQNVQREQAITDALVAAKTKMTSLDEYRAYIRSQMEKNAENALQEALRSAAWDTVLMNSEVREYPQSDIDNAIDEFKKQVMVYNNESDMDLQTFVESQGMTMEAFDNQCRQYAESKVKQNLIIQGIMDAEGISLSDEACLEIQDQLVKEFGAGSLAELLDTYGQTMIDEAIGLIRVENFMVENAVFEEPIAETTETAEPEAEVTEETTEPAESNT